MKAEEEKKKGGGQALWAGVLGDTPSVFLVASPVRRREWQLCGPADASGVCLILGHGCPCEPWVPWPLGPGGLDDTHALCSQAAAVPTPLGCRRSRECGRWPSPKRGVGPGLLGNVPELPDSLEVVSSVVPVIPPISEELLPTTPAHPHAPRAPSRGSRGTRRFEDPISVPLYS